MAKARARERIFLVHWNRGEGAARAAALRAAGFEVDFGPIDPEVIKALGARPPAAFAVDLSRLPSQGRDFALHIRGKKTLRAVPIVFVGGAPAKVANVRGFFPECAFVSWDGDVAAALRRAIQSPPKLPPGKAPSQLAGYSGTPLPKKLGVKPGSIIGLVGAPAGFERELGNLPDGASVQRPARGRRDVTLWFATSQAALAAGLPRMLKHAHGGGLWILWPKKASGVVSDVSENVVRRAGLDAGLVDFKVAAVTAIWAGLRFTKRKKEAADDEE